MNAHHQKGLQDGPVHVALLGPMGSGKTTLGRRLATDLDRPFVDSDAVIADRTGRTARHIAQTDGVAALHRLEREIFLAAMAERTPSVVAPAASIIEDPAARSALGDALCVYLRAAREILSERAAGSAHRRTIGPSDNLADREPLFEQASDVVIDTGLVSEREAIAQILAALESAPG